VCLKLAMTELAPARVRLPGGDEVEVPRVDHVYWGELWAPKDLSGLLAVARADDWGPDFLDGWRGQSNIDWTLHSGAVRRLQQGDPLLHRKGRPPEVTEGLLRLYEARLLDEARIAGHGRVGGRRLADLELTAMLQHHGAATRLLDFTENLLVATWFACQADKDRHGLLLGIDLTYNSWVLDRDEDIQRPLDNLMDAAERRLVYWKPEALTRRIPVQLAFHVWSEVVMHSWGSLASGAEDYPQEYGISQLTRELAAIAVSPALKENVRRDWQSLLGYTRARLFPDLDGFATFHATQQPLGEEFGGIWTTAGRL
jgi:hypothetical protein